MTIKDYPYEVQERAAIMEIDGGLTREDAEMRAIMEYKKQKEQENK